MVVWLSLVAGLVFGLGSARANWLWGTLLAVAPILAWWAFLVIAQDGGLVDWESQSLGLSVSGIVIGLFVGQMYGRRRKSARLVRQ